MIGSESLCLSINCHVRTGLAHSKLYCQVLQGHKLYKCTLSCQTYFDLLDLEKEVNKS